MEDLLDTLVSELKNELEDNFSLTCRAEEVILKYCDKAIQEKLESALVKSLAHRSAKELRTIKDRITKLRFDRDYSPPQHYQFDVDNVAPAKEIKGTEHEQKEEGRELRRRGRKAREH